MNTARAVPLTLFVAALSLAPMSPTRAQGGPLWRSVDMSRQLRDTLPQRIRVQYGAGKVDVRSSADPLLYAMHLRYDETRAVPLHRYDAEQRLAVLGLESRGGGLRISSDRKESGALRLDLPRTVPLDLEFELGGTQSTLELGGLTLRSLRLDCGATDATLVFSTANRAQMREMSIAVGAADFAAVHLANANADLIRVHGGVGVVDLEFGGTWTRDLTVTTSLTIGKLVLRIPSDVGVRLEVQRVVAGFDHEGLVKRDDAWYSDNWERAAHKLNVRAETFLGQIDVQRGIR